MKTMLSAMVLHFMLCGITFGQLNANIFGGLYQPDHLYPITMQDEMIGYFFCYPYQINKSGQREYKVEIFDNSFQPTNEMIVTVHNKLDLLDASSNGERFFFVFQHTEQTGVHYQMTDFKGQQIYAVPWNNPGGSIDRAEMRNSLYSIADRGFLYRKPLPGNVHTLECINNKGEIEWHLGGPDSTNAGSLVEEHEVLFLDADILATAVIIKDQQKRNSVEESNARIRITDIKTGLKVCDLDLDQKDVVLVPYQIKRYDETIDVYGQLYQEKGNSGTYYSTKTLGLFHQAFDLEGNKQSEKFISWSVGLKPILGDDFLGEGTQTKYPQIHAIYRARDQKYYAVGELYNPFVDYTECKIASFDYREYLTITLTPDFVIDTAALFRIEGAVPGPKKWLYGNFNGTGHYLSRANFADYAYSFRDSGTGSFGCVFSTGMKPGKGTKKSYHFDVVGLNREGKFYRSTIPVAHTMNSVMVLPSKYGCIAYYQIIQTSDAFYYSLQMQKFDF